MKSEPSIRFPLWVLFAVAVIFALASSVWLSLDQEAKVRKLKAEIRTRSEVANAYVLRCLLNDNVVGKNIADLPDIPTLANWTSSGNACLIQHNRLLAPAGLEIGNGKFLSKGEFCPYEFESHQDDRMYILFQNSTAIPGEGFQPSGVGFYVRNEKVWAVFECGSLVPE